MSCMKNFLLRLLETCAPENRFAQDAIECALLDGIIVLNYGDFTGCVETVMTNYDLIITHYRKVQALNESILSQTYGPLLQTLQPA